ncbi:GntR family transcriptional regulator [Actinokineospora alba]|uniref:GntR family transcriptional regulator n=1 Tax=Actinokineospora alba TaxID=504798 RepID=A0A1H0QXI8_9PSEU|nr:GntR family transcriptional regulator [Actinokineospora alba]TDP70364.1 GntR family transcriptional regulator [Actinokineospora alba]SDI33252.1 GntR family transcriptional regulator [Actinokineospora alba]SDP21589.1 GntR family transcriptional regulator [Actinokineospora alba]
MNPQAPREPKYHTIAADLATKIRSGEYRPGQALPSQRELSAAYGVTMMTLRQALRVVEDDGLVSQQVGRGTFVTEPRAAYQLDSLRGLAEDLREQGHTVRTEVVGVRPGPAPTELGTDDALRIERVRLLGGRPAVHQVSWVREPYGSMVRAVDFTQVSLYAALSEHDVVVHRATERLRPAILDTAIGDLLRQPAGVPVFVSDRVTYGMDGEPVVVDRATILGDAMEVRAERAASGLSLRWTSNVGAGLTGAEDS